MSKNLVRERILAMIRSAQPAVSALGIVVGKDPTNNTVVVQYLGPEGEWVQQQGVPIRRDRGIYAGHLDENDIVKLSFQGGNPRAPIVEGVIDTVLQGRGMSFRDRRLAEDKDPMVQAFPETLDGGSF